MPPDALCNNIAPPPPVLGDNLIVGPSTKKPAPVWRSDLPTERDPFRAPPASHTTWMPRASHSSGSLCEPCLLLAPRWKRVPSDRIPRLRQARPPNPLTRHGSGSLDLILAPPPFMYRGNHGRIEINEVIGTNAAPGRCPVTPHPGEWPEHETAWSFS